MIRSAALMGAQAARKALSGNEYERAYAVRDLLADLMHYCDEESVNFEHEMSKARANYQMESE